MALFPPLTIGQNLMHSWLHFLGWHESLSTTAIRMGILLRVKAAEIKP